MMSMEEFQIVSFSPNDAPSPNDILNIFLSQHIHTIKAESIHAISCEFSLENSTSKKIMMISVPDITRTYEGLTDVSFYFIFVHLQKLNSHKNFEAICSYINKYCDLNKKIFVFGVLNDDFFRKTMTKEMVKKIMDEKLGKNINYQYYEINMMNKKEIGDIIFNIFLNKNFSQKRQILTDKKKDVGHKAHSCVFY